MQNYQKVSNETVKILGFKVAEKHKEEVYGCNMLQELIDKELNEETIQDVKELIRDNVLCGLQLNLIIFLVIILCIAFGIFLQKYFL